MNKILLNALAASIAAVSIPSDVAVLKEQPLRENELTIRSSHPAVDRLLRAKANVEHDGFDKSCTSSCVNDLR